MKTNRLILAGLAFAAALTSSFAQSTVAVTDPVGYVTTEIAATAAGNQTYAGPVLVNQALFSGVSTNNPSGTKSITITGSLPSGVVPELYYVEIKTGTGEGHWNTITAVSGSTLTTAGNFPSGLAVGVSVNIRKHITLDDYLGANNAAGLVELNDKVELLDPLTQASNTYVWVTTANGVSVNGWYDFVTSALAGPTTIIYPGAATRITVAAPVASNLKLVSVGHVRTNKAQVPLLPGDNWLATQLPVETNLDGSGLDGTTGSSADGIGREDGNSSGDLVNILGLNQVTVPYVALSAGLGGGWYDFVSQAPSGTNPVLKETTGFVLQRKASNGAGVWTSPKPVITQ